VVLVEVEVELAGQLVEAARGVPNDEEPLLLGQLALAAGAADVFVVAAGAAAPVCVVFAHEEVVAGIVVGLPAPLVDEVEVMLLPVLLMEADLGVLQGDCV
jgi:hypothetical protein